ncbi:MAG: hypothetical protein JXL80_10185, partial [Planctomycetes bacterium]|nr:hypothetical protein [Planctomycetota bacterium]
MGKWIVTLVIALSLVAPAAGQEVQLDISSGFNWDIWCGVGEYQALMMHAIADMDIDLVEMQSGPTIAYADVNHNGPSYLLGNGFWQICNVDAELAEAMGCVQDAGGVYMGYAGPLTWNRPQYKTGTQGTPEDGVLTGADRTYHIASHAGNATLPGDWTEVEDTTTWNLGGKFSGDGLGLKFNVMASFTRNDTATLQDGAVTAELPDEQKGAYNNVNFVLAVYDGGYGGRYKRIWALYGEDGSDAELLFAWADSAADPRPQMDASDPSVYEPDFKAVYTATQFYGYSTGATGGVGTGNNTMYEFSSPRELDSTKTLWGFRLDDSSPATNWRPRGAAIWAATAFSAAGGPGRPDPVASTIVVDPYQTPSDESTPAVVTITLKDANQSMLTGIESAIDITVSGDGTSTITFVEEASEGVYTYEFTNDTEGTKYLEVSVDDKPGVEDPITISGLGMVQVFDPANVPVANAGPDQVIEDLDESGDEEVSLDGSASTDANGTIVSYVWSWYGTQLAVGETATVSRDVGAWEITLTVTDDEGFTDSDSLWVEIRAKDYDPNLTQLDISSGFNVDSLWGSYEMRALYWYAAANDPDLSGEEAQGTMAENPDMGWIVWNQYSGRLAVVNNTRDTYTTFHQWDDPQYIDGTEGLPESGYVAGLQGVDYYLPSSSGNPVMPGNRVDAADDLTLAAQLGPNGYDPLGLTSEGMDIVFNTIAVGSAHSTATWQKTEAYAELPVEQQRAYPNLNCVLAAFDNARDHRGRYMRLAAVYTDDTEEIIWAWNDNTGEEPVPDTTPYPSELIPADPDYRTVIQTTLRYYGGGTGAPGNMSVGDYALYEFAAPLTLDDTKVLKGLKLYDSNPTQNWQPRGIAIFAATAGPMASADSPLVEVSTEDDLAWVYQNIPASLARGGHKVVLTVTVTDLKGNDSVAVTLQK